MKIFEELKRKKPDFVDFRGSRIFLLSLLALPFP